MRATTLPYRLQVAAAGTLGWTSKKVPPVVVRTKHCLLAQAHNYWWYFFRGPNRDEPSRKKSSMDTDLFPPLAAILTESADPILQVVRTETEDPNNI